MQRLLVSMCCAIVVVIFTVKAESSQFVRVTAPFVNVYEQLDPKSNVIKQAKKGDYLELVYEGTAWYQVRVGRSIGWLEHKAGEVVDKPASIIPIVLVGFVICLLGTGGAVFYVISRHKTIEHA